MDCLENSTVIIHTFSGEICPNFPVCLLELIVVIAVTFLVLVGNLLGLTVLLWTPSLRNCHGYLIMSLSASDLVSGILATLSTYPSAKFHKVCWPYGDVICALQAYFGSMASLNTIFTLMLLSLERYIAVVYPLKYSLIVTKRVTLGSILVGLLVVTAGPAAMFTDDPGYVYVPDAYFCMPQYFQNPIYSALTLFGFSLPCFIVIVLTSCRVRFKLFQISRRRNLMTASTPASSTVGDEQSSRIQREPITDKLARMVRIMTITLIVTWVPFFIVSGVSILAKVPTPQVLLFGVFWLLVFNGFLNTVIYFVMNSAFREACHKMFKLLIPRACLGLGKLETRLCSPCFGTDTPGDINLQASTSGVNLRIITDPETVREHDEAYENTAHHDDDPEAANNRA